MKEKMLLLVDADGDCAGLVQEAAARTGHSVRLCRGSREAFAILKADLNQVAGVIVDLDPGAHSLALLEALSSRERRPQVLALTGWEELHMKPVAALHGAIACLGKPLAIERLRAAIGRMTAKEKISCDAWGHPSSRSSLANECLVG